MYEFSTVMVIGAVMVCNEFHGITTSAWTAWVFAAVCIGPFLVWAFTAVWTALPPNTIATFVLCVGRLQVSSARSRELTTTLRLQRPQLLHLPVAALLVRRHLCLLCRPPAEVSASVHHAALPPVRHRGYARHPVRGPPAIHRRSPATRADARALPFPASPGNTTR